MLSVRVDLLASEYKKKTDLIIERSKMLYGYTPEEKSDANENWMLRNGYLKNRKVKRDKRRRGR